MINIGFFFANKNGNTITCANLQFVKYINQGEWHTVEKLVTASNYRDIITIQPVLHDTNNPTTPKLLIKNVKLTPLQYPNTQVCLGNNIQLSPTCYNEFNSVSNINYSWSPSTYLMPTTQVINPLVYQPTNSITYNLEVSLNGSVKNMDVNVDVLNSSSTQNSTLHICSFPAEICCPYGTNNFQWNTGETTECITINSAGTYTCTSNLENCSVTNIINVVNSDIQSTITNTEIADCNNGSVSISTSLGSGYYNYYIESSTGSYSFSQNSGANYTFSGLQSKNYNITVTDNNYGCISTQSVYIDHTCNCGQDVNHGNITIPYGATANWGTPPYDIDEMDGDIILSYNSTLNINNKTIKFNTGHKIIMNKKSHLNITNNSKLTNLCDEAWWGITMRYHGNCSVPWSDAPHITINQHSTIENAVVGIDALRCYIKINDYCVFKNNYVDIRLNYFYDIMSNNYVTCRHINYSHRVNVYHTRLYTSVPNNGTLPGINGQYLYPWYHIELKNCEQASFNYNKFQSYYDYYVNNELFPLYKRGTGVYLYNSNAYIRSNTFDKLHFAVASMFGSHLTITNNRFNNNFRGVYAYNNYLTMTDNKFLVWSPSDDIPSYANQQTDPDLFPYGAYLNNAHNFKVYRNYFEGQGIKNSGGYAGMYVNNCGIVPNPIYNNTFSNFKKQENSNNSSGLVILGNNGSGNTGLEIKCNDFGYDIYGNPNYQKNTYDIALMGTVKSTQGGNDNQDVTSPANNRFSFYDFSYCPNGSNAIYSGTSQNIWYNIYGNYNNINYNPYRTDFKTCKSSLITGHNVDIFSNFVKAEACPYNPPAPPSKSRGANNFEDIARLSQYINSIETEVSEKQAELAKLIDNGNTEQLQMTVQTANSFNYENLVSEISNTSGYVSDTVILGFMDIDEGKPISKTIALLNNSPLPTRAKKKIDDTELPQSLKNYLHNYQNGLSAREQKEFEIDNLKQQMYYAIDYAIFGIMDKDSDNVLLPDFIDGFIKEFNNSDNKTIQEKIYNFLKDEGRFDDAKEKLDLLSSINYDLKDEKLQEYQDWIKLQKISLEFMQMPDTLFEEKAAFISENQDFLTSLANVDFVKGQIEAQVLLESAKLAEYSELIRLPENMIETRSMFADDTKTVSPYDDAVENLIFVYPNPVNDVLTVEYALLESKNVNYCGIYDINGRLMKSIKISETIGIKHIDVKELAEGVYILSFGSNGNKIYTKKFTVKK